MAASRPVLEWQVEPEKEDWNAQQLASQTITSSVDDRIGAAAQPTWRHRLILRVTIGVVLLSVVSAGFRLWQQAQAGYRTIQTEITQTVQLEAWGEQTGDSSVASALLDDNAAAAWRNQIIEQEYGPSAARADQHVTILDVTLQDDVAMVTVKVTQPAAGQNVAYRTTRFYRRVDDVWQRTTPAPHLLGPAQTMETDHFVFHFRHKDREAVAAAAARLDAIYSDLQRDLGRRELSSTASGKLRIEVVTSLPAAAYLRVEDNQMTVLSPRLQKIPEPASDADILAKSIIHQLIRHFTHQVIYHATTANTDHSATRTHFRYSAPFDLVVSEEAMRKPVHTEWTLVLNGLQLWQASAGSESLPQWQAETLTWLYKTAPAMRQADWAPSETDLRILCRDYAIWGVTLAFVPGPSLICRDAEWSPRIYYRQPLPDSLHELVYQYRADNMQATDWLDKWVTSVVSVTVIEYLVETYGRDHLPILIAEMRQSHAWVDLVPAVTGVPVQEFEAGWQAYVAAHYGIGPVAH